MGYEGQGWLSGKDIMKLDDSSDNFMLKSE